jgi:outer membrane protein assembly factor BamB
VKPRFVAAALWLAAALGCGGGQTRLGAVFSSDWQDDGGTSVRRISAHIQAIPIPLGTDVAVGVTDAGLAGVPLSGGSGSAAWSFAHAVDARPVVAGTVVVGLGGGELFALDAATGRKLWARPMAGAVRGVGDDGKTTIISLAQRGENGALLLAVEHDGTVVRQLEAKPEVGVPAIVGHYAFFPWQGQYVTIYDLSSGEEVARLLFREQVSRAFTTGGKLFFGELGVFRFDDRVSESSVRKASHVGPPPRELVGSPTWFRRGVEPLPAVADARDKIALFARPTSAAELSVDSSRFVATYFRIAMGLEATTGAVAWVHTHGEDIVAGSAYARGVALCDASGTVTLLDAKTGAVAGTRSLGQAVKSCVMQADGFSAPPVEAKKPLTEQIAEAIDVKENDLATAQKMLLGEAAKIQDPGATKLLIDLASDPRTSPLLVPDVASALAKRKTGAQFMLEALGRHYDFLKDVLRPPPVAPLADALAAMDEKKAAPLLASHLMDPADSSNDVKHAAGALVMLGGKPELPELRSFFALYRSAAEDDDLAAAVVSTAKALLKLGTSEDRALVERGAEDPLTLAAVKGQLAALLAEKTEKEATPASEKAPKKQ